MAAQVVSERLPESCRKFFDGHDLETKFGYAHLVATVDADGSPNLCMLSAGEILAMDERTLRVGLWMGTRTAANFRRGAPVTICFVEPDNVWYIKGRPRTLAASAAAGIERFEISIERVARDVHEGFPVSHGIKYRSESGDIGPAIKHWQTTLQALREP